MLNERGVLYTLRGTGSHSAFNYRGIQSWLADNASNSPGAFIKTNNAECVQEVMRSRGTVTVLIEF